MPSDEELLGLAAETPRPDFVRRGRRMEDFRYDEVQAKYWDITTGILLVAASVDGAIPHDLWPTTELKNGDLKPTPPSKAINDVATGLTVETSTWWPGEEPFITNAVITNRGLQAVPGAVAYNTYVAPPRYAGKVPKPDPWIKHVKKLYPDPLEHNHFFDFAAHMIQRPDQKVNHGVILGGCQGIGKDTMLLPLRMGVGEYNTAEIAPEALFSQYNPHIKSVLLVINEVRLTHEEHRASAFYNEIKTITAAPPDMLPMRELYANVVYVRNLAHVVFTTNEPLTMFIPEEDRRLFVMTSPLPDPKKNPVFKPNYFTSLHTFLAKKGSESVVRWLEKRDIMNFIPGDSPPMTAGKALIIGSSSDIRRTPLDEIMEHFEEQFDLDVIFGQDLYGFISSSNFFDDRDKYLKILKGKNVHFKMDERGFDSVRHPTEVRWAHGKFKSRIAFCRKTVPRDERLRVIEAALQSRPLEFRALIR